MKPQVLLLGILAVVFIAGCASQTGQVFNKEESSFVESSTTQKTQKLWSRGAQEWVEEPPGCVCLSDIEGIQEGSDEWCDNRCRWANMTPCKHIEVTSPYEIFALYDCWCKND